MRTVVEQAVVVAAAGHGVGVENLPPHSSGSPNELVPRGWQQCTHRRAACAGDLHSGGQRWRAEQVGRGAGILSAANSRVSGKSVRACTGAPPRPAGSRAWRPPRSCRPRPGAPRCLPRRRGRHSSERPGERTMAVRPPVKTGQVHGKNGLCMGADQHREQQPRALAGGQCEAEAVCADLRGLSSEAWCDADKAGKLEPLIRCGAQRCRAGKPHQIVCVLKLLLSHALVREALARQGLCCLYLMKYCVRFLRRTAAKPLSFIPRQGAARCLSWQAHACVCRALRTPA